MKAIDLFCGAGGASCGMYQAGVDVVAAVDQNEQALQTHKENLPCETINNDITDVDPSVLPETDVRWIHGSPPCKGFTTVAYGRDEDDPRNSLVFSFIEWVEDLQPRVVTMENVPAMTSITSTFMDSVDAAYRGAGYAPKWRVFNAADYGVPQTRKRVFYVAIREDIDAPNRYFPKPTHSKERTRTLDGRELPRWKTVGDVLEGVAADGGRVLNHVEPNHSERVESRFAQLSYGQSVSELDDAESTKQMQTRLDPSEPSPTITGGEADVVHPYEDRTLTVREMARLQSFPDWFVFKGQRTNGGPTRGEVVSQTDQVGNAVPPLLQQQIAEHLQDIELMTNSEHMKHHGST